MQPEQESLSLTEAKTVASARYRGKDWQLRRADNGSWQFWRNDPKGWTCIKWGMEADLKNEATLAEFIRLMGARPAVPAGAVRALAEKVNQC